MPVTANTTSPQSQVLIPATIPVSVPALAPQNSTSEDTANNENKEKAVTSNAYDTIVTHLAEQLYQFKGCSEQWHFEVAKTHQLNYVRGKHDNIRALIKHLEGTANDKATPLPDVLSSRKVKSCGSILNCNYECHRLAPSCPSKLCLAHLAITQELPVMSHYTVHDSPCHPLLVTGAPS